MVKRLDFTVPEFVRTIWVSEEARAVWEHRISAVSRMWQEVERTAVAVGYKLSTLQSCNPDEFINLTRWASDWNLVVAPVSRVDIASIYSNAEKPPVKGQPWQYRVVIAPPNQVRHFLTYWNRRNDEAIGDMLGYPICCQSFFHQFWTTGEWRDLTYPMVMVDGDDTTHFQVNSSLGCNILLRWLGVRRVSHLPCSFQCENTTAIGDNMRELAVRSFPQETEWLDEMLSWPVRWSSLHGIAVITTPVIRIVTSSDALAEKVTIDRQGSSYPAEGVSGVTFPFQQVYPIKLRLKLENVWKDNGFRSQAAMDDAHSVVLAVVARTKITNEKIIDLGCGNGILLSKIGDMFPDAQLSGVESSQARWGRAVSRLNGSVQLMNGDLHDDTYWQPPYGLTLISVMRLLEVDVDKKDELLERIARGSEHLIIYCYEDRDLNVSWSEFFEHCWTQNNDAGTVVYLLRSRYAKAADPPSFAKEDKFSVRGDGQSRNANAADRRRENRGRTARAVDGGTSGQAGGEDRHKSRRLRDQEQSSSQG